MFDWCLWPLINTFVKLSWLNTTASNVWKWITIDGTTLDPHDFLGNNSNDCSNNVERWRSIELIILLDFGTFYATHLHFTLNSMNSQMIFYFDFSSTEDTEILAVRRTVSVYFVFVTFHFISFQFKWLVNKCLREIENHF